MNNSVQAESAFADSQLRSQAMKWKKSCSKIETQIKFRFNGLESPESLGAGRVASNEINPILP